MCLLLQMRLSGIFPLISSHCNLRCVACLFCKPALLYCVSCCRCRPMWLTGEVYAESYPIQRLGKLPGRSIAAQRWPAYVQQAVYWKLLLGYQTTQVQRQSDGEAAQGKLRHLGTVVRPPVCLHLSVCLYVFCLVGIVHPSSFSVHFLYDLIDVF